MCIGAFSMLNTNTCAQQLIMVLLVVEYQFAEIFYLFLKFSSRIIIKFIRTVLISEKSVYIELYYSSKCMQL